MKVFHSLLWNTVCGEPAVEGVLGAAYTASLGQRVPAVSRKSPLAGLLQFMVTRILYDGFKSCL